MAKNKHYNPKTMQSGDCDAKTVESCPLRMPDGSTVPHGSDDEIIAFRDAYHKPLEIQLPLKVEKQPKRPFEVIAAEEPAAIMAACEAVNMPRSVLKKLRVEPLNGRTVKLLHDFILYHKVDTSHWFNPVGEGEPLYDWGADQTGGMVYSQADGDLGAYMEGKTEALVRSIVDSVDGATYVSEKDATKFGDLYPETVVGSIEGYHHFPWDGIVYVPEEKRIVFLEVKGNNTSSRRRDFAHQMGFRFRHVRDLRKHGFKVSVIAVFGMNKLRANERMENVVNGVGRVMGLAELNKDSLFEEPIDDGAWEEHYNKARAVRVARRAKMGAKLVS